MRKVLSKLWTARKAVGFYAAILIAGWFVGDALRSIALPDMRPMNEPMIHRIITTALIVFVIAAAIPFVPGAEIGLGLLLIFGAQAAFVVYIGMVSALLLSYLIARKAPLRIVADVLAFLGLSSGAKFCERLATSPREDRAEVIAQALPGKATQGFLSNRYVALIALLNLPGNSVLGGGGGLAFLAGASGLYRFWPYFLSVLIAVAPIPLIFALMGS